VKIFAALLIFFIFTSPLQAVTGDLNNNGKVDFTDFLLFVSNFGKEGEPGADCAALVGDLNCDSKVDFTDFITFAGNFGKEGNPESVDDATGGNTDTTAASFHAPRTFANILATSRTVSWIPRTQGLSNLARISLGIEGTQDLLSIDDNSINYGATFTVESGLTASISQTNNTLLKSMFKLIEVSTNTYKIVSAKHSNYAIDFDTIAGISTLVMRDTRSFFLNPALAAYLTFSFITSGSNTQITATGRFTYSTSTGGFVADASWTAMNVVIDGSTAILTDQTGTAFTLYRAPLDQDMPFDFNPTQVARVSNDELQASSDGSDRLEGSIRDVTDAYRSQVTAPGLNDATTTAANAMLATIDSTLTAGGSALRYSVVFYKTVRENMLTRTTQVSDMYDASIGSNTIPYVYFTNEADEAGIHHPFMVIASYGVPEGMTHLWDVSRPPGDGTPGTQYPQQKVTRNATRVGHMAKIAMKDYGEVETLTENTLASSLASEEGVSSFTHFNYASVSATGIAIDGVVVYPAFNNTLAFAQEVGEIASTGIHSGRGLATHYHADGYSATASGLNLYNAQDYGGHTHPPIISLGFDGVAGYGRYNDGDTTSDGVGVALDAWGGHTHGIYGYHYHSEPTTQTASTPGSNNQSFTAHMLPPRGAWRGKINDIPLFWVGRAPGYGGRPNRYHGVSEK